MKAPESGQLGVITRIYLKNFVTYDEVLVRPGRNLNLIIGPNGTGKSTIVSAIVLGLGGKPNVIGRGSYVKDFVKHGTDQAMIEIDLQGPGKSSLTVRRTFNLDNKTTWMVDNKAVTTKQIDELMKQFNIQVDNLCQLLPQDKVTEFSKLSQEELLKETQRSVGDPHLLEQHLDLIKLRENQKTLENELQSKTKLRTHDQQRFDAIKDSVGQINEKKQIKKRLTLMKQKRAWLLYNEKRGEFADSKKDRDAAGKKMKKLDEQLQPSRQKVKQLKADIRSCENGLRESDNAMKTKKNQINNVVEKIENTEKKIHDTEANCQHKIREEQKRDENINQLQQQKNKLENDLENMIKEYGSLEELQQKATDNSELGKLRIELEKAKRDQEDKKRKMHDITTKIQIQEQELQKNKNIEEERLEKLRHVAFDAYKGVLWLRENKDKFSHPIYEPMFLKINLKDPVYAKYFENHINFRDLTAFVCEDKQDMNLLMNYLRDQQKLKINVVHSDPNRFVSMEPSIPIEQLQPFGFENYLISLINAPETILKYLVNMYRLNNIPIGNDSVATKLDHLPQELRRFFTHSNSYSVSYSRYTGAKSVRQAQIGQANLLTITIDTAKVLAIERKVIELKEQHGKISCMIESYHPQIRDLTEKMNNLRKIKADYENQLNSLNQLMGRIDVSSKKLQSLENERMSIDEIRQLHKCEIQNIIMTQVQIYKQHSKILDDCYTTIFNSEEKKLKAKLLKNKLSILENETEDLTNSYEEAKQQFEVLEKELEPLKNETSRLFLAAKESTNGLSPEDPAFRPIKVGFAKLPASAEELFAEIQSTQAKIYCLGRNDNNDQNILQEYNNLKRNIEHLTAVITKKEADHNQITDRILEIKHDWYEKLTRLINRINSNFSTYFKQMRCAGEVSLVHDENNAMDFTKYGIRIKVKFRDADDLQILTKNHQSGGERAVTTAAYMIALQELTIVPFRCVDEINQGMDAANERRVFELIVEITSQSNSAQYFLLTPKLLPGLKYSESVTVLTVFNGPFMIPSTEYELTDKFDRMIAAIKRRQQRCI